MRTSHTHWRFIWLPLGITLGCIAVGLEWLATHSKPSHDRSSEASAEKLLVANGLTPPNSELGPAEVVDLQLSALAKQNRDGILQCYLFASPANRSITGPLSRFSALVTAPPYDVLLRGRSVLVGRPSISGGYARVLATIVGSNAEDIHVFQFELSRQIDPQYVDCWMTDAVFKIRVDSKRSERQHRGADSVIQSVGKP